jgi:hypothetical protein
MVGKPRCHKDMAKRLPFLKDIVCVYAVIAFLIQAWTILVFFRQVPSWSNYLNVQEISSVFAYRIAESFMECLFVLSILLAISFILPPRFFRDVFVVRGTAFALCLLGSIILFWKHFENDLGVSMADYAQAWTVGTILLASLFSHASARVEAISGFLHWVSDQMTVFLYILIPLSLASFIIVIFRNIR